MIRVAEKLESIADSSGSPEDVNFFGRSSFNRYYYTIYLSVRAALRARDPDMGQLSHRSVPDILRGPVVIQIKRIIASQRKKGLLSVGEGSNMSTRASEAANELADLMREAYQIRCDADYEPEFLAEKHGGAIYLRGKKLSSAASWPKRVDIRLGELMKIWRYLGFPV